MKDKKWSNALNKAWYSLDEDGDFSTMANDLLSIEEVLTCLNENTEQAVVNANKISELQEREKKEQSSEISRLRNLLNDKNDKIIQTNIENARLKRDNRKLKDCAIIVMRRILWPVDTPPSCIRSGCDEAYKMTDELLKELE